VPSRARLPAYRFPPSTHHPLSTKLEIVTIAGHLEQCCISKPRLDHLMPPERAALLDATPSSEFPPFSILPLLMILPPQPRRCCRSQSGIAGCSRRAQRRYPFLDARAPTPPSPTTRPRPFRRQPATHAARRQPAVMSASSRVSRPPRPRPPRRHPATHAARAAAPAEAVSQPHAHFLPVKFFPISSRGARAAAPAEAVPQPHAHSLPIHKFFSNSLLRREGRCPHQGRVPTPCPLLHIKFFSDSLPRRGPAVTTRPLLPLLRSYCHAGLQAQR